MINVVKLAIPFFFVAMALEMFALWRMRKLNYYRITDTINDLSCGITQQVADIFMKLVLFGYGYNYVQANWSVQQLVGFPEIPRDNVWVWIILFIAIDFVYYWFHRHSHEIALFWASHVVHHQSEEYNLAVALRQSVFQQFFSWFYYMVFAFAGVPFDMWFLCIGINLIYQFWIHTRAVGKLGFLEWFMNTPSHHRVHHGKDPKYCDKNHAGVFIIWDRMFGTFQEEEEEPIYGITVPLNSWNPIWANLGSYWSLFKTFWQAKGFKNKWNVLFNKPGWRPEAMGGIIAPKPIDRTNYQKYEAFLPKKTIAYIVFHFLVVLLSTTQLLEMATNLPSKPLDIQLTVIGGSFLALFSLNNLGGIMENQSWVSSLEYIRIMAISGGILGLLYPSQFFLGIVLATSFAILNSLWFYSISKNNQVTIRYSTPYPSEI